MPKPLHQTLAKAIDDLKGSNIQTLDVRGISAFADYMIIASGTSSRHVKALADAVIEAAKQSGQNTLSKEGFEDCEWVLVDLGDIVVHIMQPRVRDFYHLEGLWDAARIAEHTG